MDWEDRLDEWELELELSAQLEGSDWVTLDRAAADTGASRAALRTWYRTGQIPSRMVDGPHGPQRLVPLALVAARAEASPRLRRTAQRRLADQAELEILRHRVDQLELRLAALEQRATRVAAALHPDRNHPDWLAIVRLDARPQVTIPLDMKWLHEPDRILDAQLPRFRDRATVRPTPPKLPVSLIGLVAANVDQAFRRVHRHAQAFRHQFPPGPA